MSGTGTWRRGFTLIEIMIVVVLIGIVATIALPNLLEAETQAEAAALQQDVDTLRKAWIQLLAQEGTQITDEGLRTLGTDMRTVSGHVQRSAPPELAPFLTTLHHGSVSHEILDLDASGRPQATTDASGRPNGIKQQTVQIPRLLGPRAIEISTNVRFSLGGSSAHGGATSSKLLFERLGLPNYCVEIQLRAKTDQADELLRLSRRHFEEAGFRLLYTPSSGGGVVSLYFTP